MTKQNTAIKLFAISPSPIFSLFLTDALSSLAYCMKWKKDTNILNCPKKVLFWRPGIVLYWHQYRTLKAYSSSSSFPAVLTPAPSCLPTQLTLQPANQGTRLLTLGNASPCRAFPIGGLFQQVTAPCRASSTCLRHLHHGRRRHRHLCYSLSFVLFICYRCQVLIIMIIIIITRLAAVLSSFSLRSPVTLPILPHVIWMSVSVCVWLSPGGSLCASQRPRRLCIIKATSPSSSPFSAFICSYQHRLHLPTLQ